MAARKLICVFVLITCIPEWCRASDFWRFWTPADGLRELWVYNLTVSPSGKVWFTHGDPEELSFYDGYNFRQTKSVGLFNNNLVRESKTGETWMNYAENFYRLQDEEWIPIKLPATIETVLSFSKFLPTSHEHVWILHPHALYDYHYPSHRSSLILSATDTRIGSFQGLHWSLDKNVWLIGEKGVTKIYEKEGSCTRELDRQDLCLNKNEPFNLIGDGLTEQISDRPICVAQSSDSNTVVFLQWNGTEWIRLIDKPDIRSVWTSPAGQIYARDASRIYILEDGQPVPATITDSFFTNILCYDSDFQGLMWFAGAFGVARQNQYSWQRYPLPTNDAIQKMYLDSAGRLFLHGNKNVLWIDEREQHTLPFEQEKRSINVITNSISEINRNKIVITRYEPGVYVLDPDRRTFVYTAHPDRDRLICSGVSSNGRTLLLSATNRTSFHLDWFDGDRFQTVYPEDESWNVGTFPRHCITSSGEIWVGGLGGIGRFKDGRFQKFANKMEFPGTSVRSITELNDRRIWVGSDHAIYQYDGVAWTTIKTGLNTVYCIFQAKDDSVWVTSGHSIFLYRNRSWIEYTREDGLANEFFTQVEQGRNGDIWALSWDYKVFRFNPQVDVDTPETYIVPDVNPQQAPPNGEVQFSFYGRDKWDYTLMSRLYYSHRVDRNEWSPFTTDTVASFKSLVPGEHTFEVRAMDRNWNIDSTPVAWPFEVLLPWYRQPAFLLMTTLGSLLTLVFAIYALNRHVRLSHSIIRLQKAHAQLQQTQQQLIQSEKMASLGQLVAGIAHEINNPVNFIRSNIEPLKNYLLGYRRLVSQLAQDKPALPPSVQQKFESIYAEEDLEFAERDTDKLLHSFEDGSRRIARIVADLRQYSRVDKDYHSPADLHDLLDSTLNLLESRYKKRVTVHRDYGDLPPVVCSPGQMGQVFMNLLSNAEQAIEGEGNVWIRTRSEDGWARVEIRDDGQGIAPESLGRIFDPFFTTKSVGSGTGLGLSISLGIVKQHGGEIRVESEVGKGTVFVLSLPVMN